MKIAFVVNDLEGEKPGYTTTHLAREAARRGHEVRYVPLAAFSLGADGRLAAHVSCPPGQADGPEGFLEGLQATQPHRLALDDLDVMMLRNDPAGDYPQRPWARLAGVNFARFAVEAGVIVLNDPDGLLRNVNKLCLEHYPAEVRPASLISRDIDEIRAFVGERDAPCIIKPLAGSGGRNVFFLEGPTDPNIKQMIEAILSEGFALAQEAVPEAADGDLRLFLMNGEILQVGGTAAVMRRRPKAGEKRGNIRQGAVAELHELTPEIRRLAERIRPRIMQDGLFFVAVDFAGEKLLEINVFSPGGLVPLSRAAGIDFIPAVIDALEHKSDCGRARGGRSNAEPNLATG